MTTKNRYNHRKTFKKRILSLVVLASVAVIGGVVYFKQNNMASSDDVPQTENTRTSLPGQGLKGREFYRDDSREVTRQVAQLRSTGNAADAALLEKISTQPGTTWLNGPTPSDPSANQDITTTRRTTNDAQKQGTVTLYQLYAIPLRDACAGYSGGGFRSGDDYLKWVDRILAELKADAVFAVEADAVAHTVKGGCLTPTQVAERYQLLSAAIATLQKSPKVLGVYLDAGHSEWFADPKELAEPLKKAGIGKATGIAVNVSNFVATDVITPWAQDLVALLGKDKRVIIDTSRNGRGAPTASVTGDARWCNPSGRGIGKRPTTRVTDKSIDAYFWGKIIGESDGDCFGNPPAGSFVLDRALEMAKNAE